MDIPVIFEDGQLLVVDKPPGMVVDSSETQQSGTLQEIFQTRFGIKLDRGGIVHRLDKDTSGLLVVAKTQEALDNLQFQFKERMVKKEYLALVHGTMENPETVDGAIARNPARRENFIVTDDGRDAVTQFIPEKNLLMSEDKIREVFEEFNKTQFKKMLAHKYPQYTLVRCLPLTGRTHQIRVHLKYLGFPIVADSKYGGRKTARLDHRWCPRQFLHATKISFYHPVTGAKLEFESQLPSDLRIALDTILYAQYFS
jgi:23S rRNA pseudouridine1911/1915/1917 synthase